MLKALLGMFANFFLAIGFLGLAVFGIVVVCLIAGLFVADKILNFIF
ncbi:MAG: hypothetical protein L0Y74_10905 [candidate division Zixibacteria bacterium]|nr:hypothetical protein [candidate division Zixibacteria bacterium]